MSQRKHASDLFSTYSILLKRFQRDNSNYIDRSLSHQVIKDKKQTQMYSALGENKPQLILLNIECPHSLSHSRV